MSQDFDPRKDYYEELGLKKEASIDDIKSAYRKLARKWHPDTNQNNSEAQQKFVQINEAHRVLSNNELKRAYDSARSPSSVFFGIGGFGTGNRTTDININFDMFNDFFGGSVNATRNNPVGDTSQIVEGEDIELHIAISLEDAVRGCYKEIDIQSGKLTICTDCKGTGSQIGGARITCSQCGGSGSRISFAMNPAGGRKTKKCDNCKGEGSIPLNPCKTCRASGKIYHSKKLNIYIPAGVSDGDKLRIAGQGTPGINSSPGDLFIIIQIQKHEIYHREGMDLFCVHRVPLVVALKGGKSVIHHIDGTDLTITIPSGIEAGSTSLRVKGKGLNHPMRHVSGDLYVSLEVELPKTKNPKILEIIDMLEREIQNDQPDK